LISLLPRILQTIVGGWNGCGVIGSIQHIKGVASVEDGAGAFWLPDISTQFESV
jgi:hypothetical protein